MTSQPIPLHQLAACTSLYDLTTEELQAKLSSLVASVAGATQTASLDDFLLVEKQILLIHQELRERHLTAALASDPWLDSELDDVHVGQRQRQAEADARETAAVERQLEQIREQDQRGQQQAEQDQSTRSNASSQLSASSTSVAEQHWANRHADRRGLEEARRRAENGPIRAINVSQSTAALPARKKPTVAAKTKPNAGFSIPENILNQRREMVIMTSSVDNRRVNKPASKPSDSKKKQSKESGSARSSPPLTPSSSPPTSKRSISHDTSQASLRSDRSTKSSKPAAQLSASEKAKQYAAAQRQETKLKLKDKSKSSNSVATTATASPTSTAASSPRAALSATERSIASDGTSVTDSQQSTRPISTVSTVVDDTTSVTSSSSPALSAISTAESSQRPTSFHYEEFELTNEADDNEQINLSDGEDEDTEQHQSQEHEDVISIYHRPPAHPYASMDHEAIEEIQAQHGLKVLSISSTATSTAASMPTNDEETFIKTGTTLDQSPSSDRLMDSHIVHPSPPSGSSSTDSSPQPSPAVDIIPVQPSFEPMHIYEDDEEYSDEQLSDEDDQQSQPTNAAAPSLSTATPIEVTPVLSSAELAAASSAGDTILNNLKRKQARLGSRFPKASPTNNTASSSASVEQAVLASKERVARANPKKEAERAMARLAKTKEERAANTKEKDALTAEPKSTILRKTSSKESKVTAVDSTDSSIPPAASVAVVVAPPKAKRPAKPPIATFAYETILPSIEFIFSAMWSAASANGTATGQNWFAALVAHIAQCEKFKMAFGLPSTRRPQRSGSAHARNRLIGATVAERASGLAADELRLEYLTATIQAGGPGAALAAKQKLSHTELKSLEQSRLLKAQRAHQQNLLTHGDEPSSPTPTTPSEPLETDEPEDDELLARDHGPNGNSSALIFLVTHEREEVYTVVRQALLALQDEIEPQLAAAWPAAAQKEEEKDVNAVAGLKSKPKIWIECPIEDAPKPDKLYPFLPPNFTSAAIGGAPAYALPAAPIPLYANPPSAAANNKSASPDSTGTASSSPILAPQPGVEFSSIGGQFHELSSTSTLLSGVPSARGSPSLYWNLLWTWKKPHLDYSKLFAWQKVNHFPNSMCLTRKDLLKKQLDKYTSYKGFKHRQEWKIMPTTFLLPQEYQSFIDCFARQSIDAQVELQNNPTNPPLSSLNYWICKPPSLSRGRGIFVTDKLEEIDYKEPLIIQKYILNPLLLHGYKFDLRLYVVVTSIQPLEVFLYREGFARISTTKFSTSATDLKNKFIHLTNSSVQKNNILTRDGKEIGGAGAEPNPSRPIDPFKVNRTGDPRFDQPAGQASISSSSDSPPPQPKQSLTDDIFHDPLGEGGSKISLAYLWQHLRSIGINTDEIWSKIIKVVLKTLVAVEDDITPSVNSFELFGFDILISDDLEAHLIEVNASPSMGLETPLDQLIKPRLIRDIVNLVAPLPTHRYFLQQILERRFKTGYFERIAPKTREKKVQLMNELLHHMLLGEKPRLVGDLPKKLGLFERIAPLTPSYDAVMKMKRSAFQPTTNLDHKYKRSLPPMV